MARMDIDKLVRLYQDAKSLRSPHESDWRMASAYCMPAHYNAWNQDGPAVYGPTGTQATKRIAYDTTGTRSLRKYVAVLTNIATPHDMTYQTIIASDTSLMRKQRVRAYFDDLTNKLYEMRYMARAHFIQAISEVYGSMGTYGTGPMYLGKRTPNALYRGPSFIYKACPMRDIFILVNDEGEVTMIFRRFWLNVRQFRDKFPGEALPKNMQAVASGNSETRYFEFIHAVMPREDFDPQAIDARRHPIQGVYAIVDGKEYVGDEHGFRSFPYITPRTFTEAGSPYGYAPAAEAMAAMGTASAIKKTTIKQGQKAVDPTLLVHDDGAAGGIIDQRPGALIYGGVNSQGKELVKPLAVGNFNVAEKMLQDERMDIEDSFFAIIFRIIMETPEMTATQVIDRVKKEGALLAPTMGRIQSELQGPQMEREIDLLDEMGLMPKMPPELIEARGEYQILYTSPMAKAMYMDEVGGFNRTVEMALNVSNATGDPSHLDHFDFDTAIPEIADYMATPARWMRDPKVVAQMRQKREEDAEASEVMNNAGGLASAAKAVQSMEENKSPI